MEKNIAKNLGKELGSGYLSNIHFGKLYRLYIPVYQYHIAYHKLEVDMSSGDIFYYEKENGEKTMILPAIKDTSENLIKILTSKKSLLKLCEDGKTLCNNENTVFVLPEKRNIIKNDLTHNQIDVHKKIVEKLLENNVDKINIVDSQLYYIEVYMYLYIYKGHWNNSYTLYSLYYDPHNDQIEGEFRSGIIDSIWRTSSHVFSSILYGTVRKGVRKYLKNIVENFRQELLHRNYVNHSLEYSDDIIC